MFCANTTVPFATTLISVPDEQAISKPVCAPDLIELETPNLEEILPETGSTDTFIPSITAIASFASFSSKICLISFSTDFSATSILSVLTSSNFWVYFSFTMMSN